MGDTMFTEAIDNAAWEVAWRSARSRPGMADIMLKWNPYECKWICEISYADSTRNCGQSPDINEAIRQATAANEKHWQANPWL
jgi:hypothetical protein